jgi:hypothetical protein
VRERVTANLVAFRDDALNRGFAPSDLVAEDEERRKRASSGERLKNQLCCVTWSIVKRQRGLGAGVGVEARKRFDRGYRNDRWRSMRSRYQ